MGKGRRARLAEASRHPSTIAPPGDTGKLSGDARTTYLGRFYSAIVTFKRANSRHAIRAPIRLSLSVLTLDELGLEMD